MVKGKVNDKICFGIIFMMVCTIVLIGCGGGGGGGVASAPSGVVVQGAVSGATVFADHLTGAEANRKIDADEAATVTTTRPDGTFTYPVTPGYDYVTVSFGGTDTITGLPAMPMLAPAGVGVVSPLTTMVALVPESKDVIKSLGVDYTADLSKQVTPAALLLVQSVQAAVSATMRAIDPGSDKLKYDQANAIQQTVMAQIAAGVAANTKGNLTNPAALTTMLQSSVRNALNGISSNPNDSNITIPDATILANTVVTGSLINSVAAAVDGTGSFSTNPNDARAEGELISGSSATAIKAATDQAATNASTLVTATKKDPGVHTITGAPANSVAVGATYSFVPTAYDEDGDTVVFSIVNKPAWATFNSGTGELSGTPTEASVGTTTGIVISFSDGPTTVSLPAFSINVYRVTGSQGNGG